MLKLIKSFALAAILVVSFTAASVAQRDLPIEAEPQYKIIVLTANNTPTIAVQGEFAAGITKTLRKVINKYPHITTIAFQSPGGNANEAFDMAQLLNEKKWTTIVPQGRICLSACAIAFMAGSEYIVEGILGYHNAWIPSEQSVYTKKEFNEGFNLAQLIGGQTLYYKAANGFVFDFALQVLYKTSPTKFAVFTETKQFYNQMVSDRDDFTTYHEQKGQVPVWDNRMMGTIATALIEKETANPTFFISDVIEIVDQPCEEISNEIQQNKRSQPASTGYLAITNG